LTFNLLGSIGLFDFWEIAVDMPVHAVYRGDAIIISQQSIRADAGLGDIRLINKFAWWLGGTPSLNYYLGFDVPVIFPTGDSLALRGSGGFGLHPRMLFGFGATQWQLALNLGYRTLLNNRKSNLAGGREFTYGTAFTLGLTQGSVPLDFQAELVGGHLPDAADGKNPLELLAGLIVGFSPGWSAYVAGGPGLTDGLNTPDFRIIGGIRYASKVGGRDRYTDSDHDRVPDYRDDAPFEPEDYDGFEDEDGKPELDNDEDGVMDDDDECPNQAEEPNGDKDGCPERAKIIVRRDSIIIYGKIQFETGSDQPLKKSRPLLDDLAEVLNANPQVKQMTIIGHTDNIGPADFNQHLSEQRAAMVKKELMDRDVKGHRMVTVGYGFSRPLAPNETRAGRAINRRVEFIINEYRK
jgi:outer membrane protein OmpA-like peptidoglycan-associated protein